MKDLVLGLTQQGVQLCDSRYQSMLQLLQAGQCGHEVVEVYCLMNWQAV